VTVTLNGTFSKGPGTGTVDVNLGWNDGDITPPVPPDNAPPGTPTTLVYISVYNPTPTAIVFGSSAIQIQDTASLGAASCELDVENAGGWQFVNSGPITTGGSGTMASIGTGQVQFSPGQSIVAIACE
jgi:hypothetical protein